MTLHYYCTAEPRLFSLQYLQDLKERGAKIIIGEFYASSARQIMCAAYKERMTQREGYVWFLPGW